MSASICPEMSMISRCMTRSSTCTGRLQGSSVRKSHLPLTRWMRTALRRRLRRWRLAINWAWHLKRRFRPGRFSRTRREIFSWRSRQMTWKALHRSKTLTMMLSARLRMTGSLPMAALRFLFPARLTPGRRRWSVFSRQFLRIPRSLFLLRFMT